MTFSAACIAAIRAAKNAAAFRYVVEEEPGYFQVADDFDLGTFFAGAPVRAAIDPDGEPA